jgi:hypothetical protein
MIITDKFIKFMDSADSDTQKSVYNFAILTCSRSSFKSRVMVAIEIILGEKFCLWISRNQKNEGKEVKIQIS